MPRAATGLRPQASAGVPFRKNRKRSIARRGDHTFTTMPGGRYHPRRTVEPGTTPFIRIYVIMLP